MSLTISWSQLRTFAECKQRVKLMREGKRTKAADARVFLPGSIVDRVVCDWLKEGSEPGRMPSMVSAYVDPTVQSVRDEGRFMKWKDRDDRAQVTADCIEAVTKIEPALLKYVVPFDHEEDFRFRVPLKVPAPDNSGAQIEVLLIGAMDIAVHNVDKDWRAVFDVKMTRDDYYWKKTMGQLTFYDLATELLYGAPTKAVALFQPMCKLRVKPIEITAQMRMEMLQTITTFARAVVLEDFPVAATRAPCAHCDFKHACPKQQGSVNDRGQKVAF